MGTTQSERIPQPWVTAIEVGFQAPEHGNKRINMNKGYEKQPLHVAPYHLTTSGNKISAVQVMIARGLPAAPQRTYPTLAADGKASQSV